MEEKRKATEAAQLPPHKDKKINQLSITFRAFYSSPKTMLDVSIETEIRRANICRYVASMEKEGKIKLLYKAKDKTTRHLAGYYTTNKELFHADTNRQLELWFNNEKGGSL